MDVDKLKKLEYGVGINLLNKGPAEQGIEFLINRGFIKLKKPNGLTADIARFMRKRPCLSKKRITDYLLDTEKEFNCKVLREFVMQQKFKGKPSDEALRILLSTIKLPPNAKTGILMHLFAERYAACNPAYPNGNKDIQSSPSKMTDGKQVPPLLTVCPRSSFDESSSSSSVDGHAGMRELTSAPVPYLTKKQAFVIATEIIAINQNFHVPSFQRLESITRVDFLENMVQKLGVQVEAHERALRSVAAASLPHLRRPVDFVYDDYLMLIYRRIRDTPLPQGEDHVDTLLK